MCRRVRVGLPYVLCECMEGFLLEGKGRAVAANTLSALVWSQPSLGMSVRVVEGA